jgi:hypothetical protein
MRVIEKKGISQNSARFSRASNGIDRDACFIAGLIGQLLMKNTASSRDCI